MLRLVRQFCKAVILLKPAFSLFCRDWRDTLKYSLNLQFGEVSFLIIMYFSVFCLIFYFCVTLPSSKAVQEVVRADSKQYRGFSKCRRTGNPVFTCDVVSDV